MCLLAVERMSGLQGLRLRDILPLLQMFLKLKYEIDTRKRAVQQRGPAQGHVLSCPLDNSTLASMNQYARKETCSQSGVSVCTSDIVVSRREECSQEDLRNVNLVKVSCPNRS